MVIISWVWATLLLNVSCAPLHQITNSTKLVTAGTRAEAPTNDGHSHQTSSSYVSRAVSTAISLICISLLSGMIGIDWLFVLH
jgi:hypothetical protein